MIKSSTNYTHNAVLRTEFSVLRQQLETKNYDAAVKTLTMLDTLVAEDAPLKEIYVAVEFVDGEGNPSYANK